MKYPTVMTGKFINFLYWDEKIEEKYCHAMKASAM